MTDQVKDLPNKYTERAEGFDKTEEISLQLRLGVDETEEISLQLKTIGFDETEEIFKAFS